MTPKKVRRVTAREGYDRWAGSYDATANPVVAMDDRHTFDLLSPAPGETILDAGCGTGRHLQRLCSAGAATVGVDFSAGMLGVLRKWQPHVPLVRADLHGNLPFASDQFDAVLCALVGEHLTPLTPVFTEFSRVLTPGGRLVFSVYHPRMAQAGREAHFEREGIEYRLGAERHDVDDYAAALRAAGLRLTDRREWTGDEALAMQIPAARKYIDFPLLLAFVACRDALE